MTARTPRFAPARLAGVVLADVVRGSALEDRRPEFELELPGRQGPDRVVAVGVALGAGDDPEFGDAVELAGADLDALDRLAVADVGHSAGDLPAHRQRRVDAGGFFARLDLKELRFLHDRFARIPLGEVVLPPFFLEGHLVDVRLQAVDRVFAGGVGGLASTADAEVRAGGTDPDSFDPFAAGRAFDGAADRPGGRRRLRRRPARRKAPTPSRPPAPRAPLPSASSSPLVRPVWP